MKKLDLFVKKSFLALMATFTVLLAVGTANSQYQQLTSSPPTTGQKAPENFIFNSKAELVAKKNVESLAQTGDQPGTDPSTQNAQSSETQQLAQSDQPSKVLGTDTSFMFSGSENYGSNGGVLVLNAQQTPSIAVSGHQRVSGQGTFTLYKVTKQDLLNYLLYSQESEERGSAIEKTYQFDTNIVPAESSFQATVQYGADTDRSNEFSLPIEGTGIWFLKGDVNGATADTMIVRSNLAGIIHQGDNQNLFWVQDTNYASVPDATIELFNTANSVKTLQQLTTNAEGLATDGVNEALDFAIVSKNDDLTMIPVNLENLNYRSTGFGMFSSSFSQRQPYPRLFTFTDRFLYKPGDTVHYKAIVRTEDDADFTISPRVLSVELSSGSDPISQQTVTVSNLGTVDADFLIPEDATAGYYEIRLVEGESTLSYSGIQVANFRKPDASISVSTEKLAYLPNEKVVVNISGTAFLGQPLRNQTIKYKVYQEKAGISGDYTTMSFTPGDDYFSTKQPLTEGTVKLDKAGKAQFELLAQNTTGYRQFWIINTEYLDGASVSATDAVKTLIQPGDFILEDDTTNQIFVQNTPAEYPIKLSKNKIDAKISGITVSGKLSVYESADNYTVVQSNLSATSNEAGKLVFSFTPKEAKSYKLELETKDENGNLIKGEESFYANKTAYNNVNLDIFEITTDKETYNVGDTAKVTVKTQPEIKHVFVSLGRRYSREYRVLALTNGTASFEFEVKEKYQPNIYLYVGSFLKDSWRIETTNIDVNTSDKEITISIQPSQATYGPAETAQFEVTTTDGQGRPVATDLAFWIFDKALLELHGNYFEGIFDNFWFKRGYSIPTNFSYQGIISSGAEGGGGCFAGETLITMADGSKKRIDQITVGENITTLSSSTNTELVTAQVLGTHVVNVDGYLILNGTTKITPEHILLVNGDWKTAGEINVGDILLSSDGTEQRVNSLEWQKGDFTVYNLEVETYRTFLANDIYVHNQKGEVRSTFKDTAYWNPHVTTGDDGKANVTVELPDNLTTWVVAAVAANGKTQVGDGKTEFIVTKELVVRPIFPLFLRNGDQVTLAALISNFSPAKDTFDVAAKMIGGELQGETRVMTVNASDIEDLYWPVKVTGSNEEAVFTVTAKAQKNTKLVDEVIEKFPIYEYGSWITKYSLGKDTVALPLAVSSGTDPARTETTLQLHASQYPALASILENLLDTTYDYNIEDHAGVLIAASILREQGAQLGIPFNQSTLNQKVTKAVEALRARRDDRGIWMDYSTNRINSQATILAMESLSRAQEAGYTIDQDLIDSTLAYISNWNTQDSYDTATKQYIFSLFPDKQLDRQAVQSLNTDAPETLAQAALANHRQGFSSAAEAELLKTSAGYSAKRLGWNNKNQEHKTMLNSITVPTVWATYAIQEIEAAQPELENAFEYLHRNVENDPQLQALLALTTVKYYEKTKQLSPNYTYRVLAGEAVLSEGTVTAAQQKIEPIQIEPHVVTAGTAIQVEKTGTGQLFSQLAVKEFYSERSVAAQQESLNITRKYLSTKPAGEPTTVGDLIIVKFEVEGLGLGETNIEIEDYLPSGLMAIDETLDNGTFEPNENNTSYARQLITEQGMKLTFETLGNKGTYSYKARVVSEGVFDTPPAVLRLKNDPSLWASTASETLIIDGKSLLESINPKAASKTLGSKNLLLLIAGIVLGLGALAITVAYKYKEAIRAYLQKRRNEPPQHPPEQPLTPPPTQPQV